MIFSVLVKKCAPVVLPNRGEVSPSSCETGPSHGETCVFSCQDDFEVDKSQASCSNGVWSSSPVFNCLGKIPKYPFNCANSLGLNGSPTHLWNWDICNTILWTDYTVDLMIQSLSLLWCYSDDFVLHCHGSILACTKTRNAGMPECRNTGKLKPGTYEK